MRERILNNKLVEKDRIILFYYFCCVLFVAKGNEEWLTKRKKKDRKTEGQNLLKSVFFNFSQLAYLDKKIL
jgi:hypothetical protein